MKKLCLMIILIFICVGLTGCGGNKEIDKNKQYQQILEQQGYVYITVDCGELITETIGYVEKEVISNYLNGSLSGKIQVLHPYEENKSILINVDAIKRIKVNQ